MQQKSDIISVDEMMDERFGKVGSNEREAFRQEAYTYCVGQLINEARKREKITQQELLKYPILTLLQKEILRSVVT
jgi:hypothetical protein